MVYSDWEDLITSEQSFMILLLEVSLAYCLGMEALIRALVYLFQIHTSYRLILGPKLHNFILFNKLFLKYFKLLDAISNIFFHINNAFIFFYFR